MKYDELDCSYCCILQLLLTDGIMKNQGQLRSLPREFIIFLKFYEIRIIFLKKYF